MGNSFIEVNQQSVVLGVPLGIGFEVYGDVGRNGSGHCAGGRREGEMVIVFESDTSLGVMP